MIELTPHGRLGEVADMADAVVFLASDAVPLHHRRRAARRRRHGHVSCEDASKPVIVYGASGYTGRLICEYLREYNVPFVAAGRDKARSHDVDGASPRHRHRRHEIVEVEHDVEPLTELFDGAQVVSTPSARSPSTAARSSRPASTPARTTSTPPGSRTG